MYNIWENKISPSGNAMSMNFFKPATILVYFFPVYRKYAQWLSFYMGCLKVSIPHSE
jgi:hypothetical protein